MYEKNSAQHAVRRIRNTSHKQNWQEGGTTQEKKKNLTPYKERVSLGNKQSVSV